MVTMFSQLFSMKSNSNEKTDSRRNVFRVITLLLYFPSLHFRISPSLLKQPLTLLTSALSCFAKRCVKFESRPAPNAIPRIGSSIEIQGTKNAGTLGGFIALTRNGHVRRGFLTNYHVFRLSESRENSQVLVDLVDNGIH